MSDARDRVPTTHIGNSDSHPDDSRYLVIQDLRQQRKDLRRRATRYAIAFYAVVAIGWLAPFAYYALIADPVVGTQLQALPGVIGFVLVAVWMAAYLRSQVRAADADLQDLDFEVDLQQFEVLSRERRAEKIVRIHNLQLRRYYDLNL